MNESELKTLLQKRSGTERKVYDSLQAHGRMTDRQLRDLLHSPGSGPRDALAKMLPLGLVRYAGKASSKGSPMQYEATPAGEVEDAAERFAVLKPKRSRRTQTAPGARLADLRQLQQGDCRKWYPVRDQILATLPLLSSTVKMAFWESVPIEELELALDEIEELHDAAGEALASGRERLEHEKYKAKIEKIQRTQGRTVAEKNVAARKAETLSRRLIQK